MIKIILVNILRELFTSNDLPSDTCAIVHINGNSVWKATLWFREKAFCSLRTSTRHVLLFFFLKLYSSLFTNFNWIGFADFLRKANWRSNFTQSLNIYILFCWCGQTCWRQGINTLLLLSQLIKYFDWHYDQLLHSRDYFFMSLIFSH